MKNKLLIILMFLSFPLFGQTPVTGLNGWDIFLDPGHSQNENMPTFTWAISEAKRNLRVARQLRDILLTETDIDTVYMCRGNDQVSVSLSDRTRMANNLGASWYHSIHTDAGGASQNSTLLLWGQKRDGSEKVPNGGHAMADIMINYLTKGMRTYTEKGSIGDCTFYGCDFDGPYLYVNRNTTMPSELSEAGFHTNPRQNQLYMNNEWRRLEARTFYWSILEYHNIEIPEIDIVAGLVLNSDTETPINGAKITVNDTSYITDTYESLFYQYTEDPELLGNGFYYLEGIEGDSVKIVVSAEDYYSDSMTVKMKTDFFTFQDFLLISKIPPKIAETNIVEGDTSFSILNDIEIEFSRPMNTAAFDSAFSITPNIGGTLKWYENDMLVKFVTDSMDFKTNYTVTITEQAKDKYGHLFDGNGDGVPGESLSINFRTGYDIYSPEIIAYYPATNQKNVHLSPIIRFLYDEAVDSASVYNSVFKLERFSDKSSVEGKLKHYTINDKTVLNFFPENKLQPNEVYVNRVSPGIKDLYGNESTKYTSVSFITGTIDWQITEITSLESDILTDWWQPTQSGSTTGTKSSPGVYRAQDTLITNLLSSGNSSMKLFYDWDLNSDSWLIREYLGSGTARSITFDTSYTLQCYVFGDGSNTKFRFALDEGDGSNWPNHEVSNWFTIDWYGWKLVQWELNDSEQVGAWGGLGNSVLDNSRYRIDSFQLSYEPGNAESGYIYLDDLQLIKETIATDIEEDNQDQIFTDLVLVQNYPNPFNPKTRISFYVPEANFVTLNVYNILGQKVANLLSKNLNPGEYAIQFNADKLASGTYIYELKSGNETIRKRMQILK